MRALEVHHAVAEKPKPVASMGGHPISHATKRGFKRGAGEVASARGEDFGPVFELVGPRRKQWATKLGSWSRWARVPAASARAVWWAPFAPFSSRAVGVGHARTRVWRSIPPDPLAAFDVRVSGPRDGTVGVGQKRACWSSPISSLRAPPRQRKLSAAGVCHERLVPVSESVAPGWFPQLPASSPRAAGHISAVRER